MNRLNRRCATVIAVLLLILTIFSPIVCADEPFPFQIKLIPEANYALTGQPFRYEVVITHAGRIPVQNVLVMVKMPAGTTYRHSNLSASQRWLLSGFAADGPQEVSWLTRETLAPGEVVRIELVVDVLPEAGQKLVNEGYLVTTLADYRSVAAGPPVITTVLRPTPAAPAASRTNEVTAAPRPASSPGPVSVTQPSETSVGMMMPEASSRPAGEVQSSSSTAALPVIVISGLALLGSIATLVWFLRR